MNRRPAHLFATLASLVAFCACGGGHDTSKPEGAIGAAVEAMEDNDLAAVMQILMPPAELVALKEAWAELREEAPSADEALQFRMSMAMLTPKGAEEEVFAQVEPMLQEAQQQLKQMSGLFMMVAGVAASSDDLSDEEKQQAQDAVGAVTAWLTELDITDTKKAKKAIRIACETARELDLDTMKDLQGLGFDQLLDKGGVMLGGVKDLLAVYDLDLDAVLGSVKIGKPTIDGTSAKVPMSFTIFGAKQEGTAVLKQIDGAWFIDPE